MSEMNCGLYAYGPQTCNLDLTSLYYFNQDHSIEINIILVSGPKMGAIGFKWACVMYRSYEAKN